MKIYNKRSFVEGAFMVILGSLNLVTGLANHIFDIKRILLIVTLYFMGGGMIIRSLFLKFSREDNLEKMDKQKQLITLKSKSKAFGLTQTISFLLMLGLIVMGKISGYEGFIAMAVGLGFAFSISMFTEIFTSLYYDSKK